jgi:hypothetical protein
MLTVICDHSRCLASVTALAHLRHGLGDGGAAGIAPAEAGGGAPPRPPHHRQGAGPVLYPGGRGRRAGVLAPQGCGGAQAGGGLLEAGAHKGDLAAHATTELS